MQNDESFSFDDSELACIFDTILKIIVSIIPAMKAIAESEFILEHHEPDNTPFIQ